MRRAGRSLPTWLEVRCSTILYKASPSQACGWTPVDRAKAARKRKHRPPTKSNPRILPLKICHCGVRRQTRLIILIDLKLLKITMPTTTPTILNQINAEKTKVSERLVRLDADRAKIATELIDLETAERVLTRVSKAPPARRPRSTSAAEAKAKASNATRGR